MQIGLLVIDSGGIGGAPDAERFGDKGANTLGHTAEAVGGLALPHLAELGLAELLPMADIGRVPLKGFGMAVQSQANGKDTLAGHWEMMGITVEHPFRTFAHGFPADIVAQLEKAFGRSLLGNEVASGTEIIARLGPEHLRSGKPIVYTSADSVLQIAAHEAVVPLDQLYAWCEAARAVMVGPNLVGRIIARPFVGEPGRFERTPHRRDLTVRPPGPTMVDVLQARGVETVAIGKIGDIFSGQGFERWIHTENNRDGLERTVDVMLAPLNRPRFIFTNLVEFDSHYGHRRDVVGYARALKDLDSFLPRITAVLGTGDQLWITADHGCDPTYRGTDHTRERLPWLAAGPGLTPGVGLPRNTLADIAATLAVIFDAPVVGDGRPVAALQPHA
ncbi:MAG: phosphopentomutase [Thermaerobacter sp.]|nr:phosphopentomutase [Thermaerobacter sp.]